MAEKAQLEVCRGPGMLASRQAPAVSEEGTFITPKRRSSQDGAGTQLFPHFPIGEMLA